MKEFFIEYITPHLSAFLGAVLTGLAGFIFGKERQKVEVEGLKAEADSKEIENAEKVLRYYREMVEDLAIKLKTAITELDEAKAVIKELEAKVEALTLELTKYKQLNGKREHNP
ncbi:cell wall anchor protein [Riemerella anatipestifer]|uniref:cell wall anchor protein n=1 Tax=Riemerella anatipestifer TaxID=34085 RepID=UPI0013735143|nr:cell wall anchor protein [Riemerella anatipestifer]MBT0550261.1 cell wall anchor protein [Riemerella anatipestifer]MBT0556985.1 cell wall anchor protein [Riemerella anatipestifer]MBT0561021.1 cell wall anchor protein [Riemerella anatipestifer]NAV17439.1 cell wall anchor protein [Riemerella anatipestifer]